MKSNRAIQWAFKIFPLLFLNACSGLEVVNSVSRLYNVNVKTDLPFAEDARLKYDLYLPSQANEKFSRTPVIVFFYGGSWNRGDKSEYEFVGRRLASLGYITAVPNYRLYPTVTYPDFLNDGAQSIASLAKELKKTQYKVYKPTEQYILMGHSAGAYNAAMLALDAQWLEKAGVPHHKTVQGFIGLAGAYNIYPIQDAEVRPVFLHPAYPPQSQPIDHAAKKQVPSLILSPATDTLVSIERNSETLHKTLSKAGNTSTLHTVAGTNHITLLATLSPLLFFKGSSVKPIREFINQLQTANKPGTP